MSGVTGWLLKRKKAVVIFTVVAAVLCAVLFFTARVNYSMADYLPKDAESTVALQIMREEFPGELPNLSVMVENVSIPEALKIKQQLQAIKGVSAVMWLDDVLDITVPIETMDADTLGAYYKDGAALFSVTVQAEAEVAVTDAIDALIGPENALAGEAMNTAVMRKMSVTESLKAICILLPIILLILILTTSSWLEPLLYLCAVGAAVIINMGTNAFLPSISFITLSVSPILQLAVSLDYSIILLNAFRKFRTQTDDPAEAMRLAVRRAATSISASAATTILGFAALLFMRFEIGSDLGLNLVKGIILSFLSVIFFLPSLTLLCLKLLEKTRHKPFFKETKSIGRRLFKLRVPSLVLVLILIVPCIIAAQHNAYIYGNGKSTAGTRGGQSARQIAAHFSQTSSQVLLVKKGDPAREKALCEALGTLDNVKSVSAYATLAGAAIPSDFVDASMVSQLYSPHYARIIITCSTESEGDEAFALVRAIRETAGGYYDDFHLLGESANLYDMKLIIEHDTTLINLLAIAGIFFVLLLAFRSPVLPVLLVFAIQSAIYINLALAYFSGNPLCYIGYLVISTVQLGATVDYAIMLTDAYTLARRHAGKKEAMIEALNAQLSPILISGGILTAAGFCLMLTSSNPIVSELGLLLGRGTLLSVAMVLLALPALLMLFDRITLKLSFARKEKTAP